MPSNHAVSLSSTWDSWEQTSAGNRSIPGGMNYPQPCGQSCELHSKLSVGCPDAADIGVWTSEDFPTTICFRRYDMSVDTRTCAVINSHGRNSFRISDMRTAPVVGYGRPKDHPRATVLTRSFSEMESIMDTKRNTDGLQRPWCPLGLPTTITLRCHLDRPPQYTKAIEGHWEYLCFVMLWVIDSISTERDRVAAVPWSASQTPASAFAYVPGHALEVNS
jgi:hypothetical protein